MRLRNKESHPPQAAEVRVGQVTGSQLGPAVIPGCLTGANGLRACPGTTIFRCDAPRLSAELYQPCAVEAVDAVILAEMAGQSPQITLRGDPFGVRADLVRPNLAPLDR
jgi:hypothetical protein